MLGRPSKVGPLGWETGDILWCLYNKFGKIMHKHTHT